MTVLDFYIPTYDVKSKNPFDYNSKVENLYLSFLFKIAQKIKFITAKIDKSRPDSVLTVLKELSDYSQKIKGWSERRVQEVLKLLNNESRARWATDLQGYGADISRLLRQRMDSPRVRAFMAEFLDVNASLISDMPLHTAREIQKMVLDNLITGAKRPETLADDIIKKGAFTYNRARLIARTETSKMSTALTQARSEDVGIRWYVWRTSQDARVRSSHSLMNRVLIRWSDPPSPEALDNQKRTYGGYHPGGIFNCRCYAQPLIRLSDVVYPVKVYYKGRIETMRRSDFIKISEGQVPLAA